MNKILFREIQQGHWAYFGTAAVIIFLTLSYYFQWGTNPIPWSGYIILTLIFIGIFFLFCKMETTIDEQTLHIRYGMFGFSKKVALSNIQDVKQKKYPFYYGVGIRKTPNGTLYCVNFSQAVEITLKDSPYTISIGTARANELMTALQEMAKHNV